MNTKQIGQIVESRFVFECSKLGIPVSQPIGDNLPYDFIIDIDRLYKVQCKSLRKDGSGYTAETHRKEGWQRMKKASYKGLIDLFFFYNLEDDIAIYLPINEAGSNSTKFKIVSRQSSSRLVEDYKDINEIVKRIK